VTPARCSPSSSTGRRRGTAAERELRRREYVDAQPSPLVRLVGRVLREIGELLASAAEAAPGGRLGLLALLALVGLLVAVVLAGWGRSPARPGRPRCSPAPRPSPPTSTARRPSRPAEQGRWADAVRERLRAVVRELEARGALDPRPGRTAGEVARDGGAAVPDVAPDLARAAALFDEVWYGGRPADASSYALLVAVDERVSDRRPVAR
jgi:hypothetical protein